MKDMGMEKIIFEERNVLSLKGEEDFITPEIEWAYEECLDIFGKDSVMIITRDEFIHTRKTFLLKFTQF